MALSLSTQSYLAKLGLLREIDASTGPKGPNGVTAYKLVPKNGYLNGERFPHEVSEDLDNGDFDTVTVEGLEYYRVPENSTNIPGRLSHYAQTTGVAELQNPPGGGVNRVRETFEKTAESSVAPQAVEEFVSDNDSFEEQVKKEKDESGQLRRAISEKDDNSELDENNPRNQADNSKSKPAPRNKNKSDA